MPLPSFPEHAQVHEKELKAARLQAERDAKVAEEAAILARAAEAEVGPPCRRPCA